ncbi:hypothetical protein ACR79N_16020 [Sphingobacterium siyangense]|uniref:hypothetical protein n=1 Tax=Sphingobacterium siyangense TaxID=459529 RepID=UPI003DA3F33D
MVDSQGWVKLHRSILEWEWYSDINTKVLFLHLLLKSNHKDKKFQGMTVKRGQVVTGLSILSLETSLSVQRLRTSLNKLKSTNEITIETSSKGTVITIVNYDFYQITDDDQQAQQQTINKPSTSDQQTNNKRSTTNKNVKKDKKEINKENSLSNSVEETSTSPPKKTIDDRKSEFKSWIDPFREKYSREMLNDFWRYWTEIGEKDKKMRFEKEKTFGTGQRLSTWKRNESKFNKDGKINKRGNASRTEPSKAITDYGKL